MIENFKDEKIVLEIRELIEGVETAKEKMYIYGDLVKQIFLSGSNQN